FYVYEKCSGSSRFTRNLSLAAFFVFLGVGLIAKGLIGAVFPIAIVTFYFVLARRWPSRHFIARLPLGLLLTAAVAALWYLPMFFRHGWEFWDEFFVQHHFQRYTSNKYRHPGPFWYFLAVLPVMTFPWIPFFAASVWKSIRRMVFRGRRRTAQPDFVDEFPDLVIFSFAWMLVPLVFFSLSGSKLPGYILPALPPALVLTALFLCDAAKSARWKAAAIKLSAFLMLAGVSAILAFALPQIAEQDSVKSMIRKADAGGYRGASILNMHTTSHNAEFYGAGRLVRDKYGRQWRFLGVPGVAKYIKENGGKPVLVVIPFEFERQLISSDLVSTEVIARNGELVMFGVKARKTGENGNEN
ncbi:MAG: hypothetical protein OEQ28_08185, partial [Acidobacteriota bacterium]|nr:hypothetical protein [Acidobacteriota bacterium]